MGGVCFVLSSVTGIPVEKVFKGALFYMPALLAILAIVTYVPAITLWLPHVLGLS
jgi:TRAP-type C4-dicarboxylate transport system permease large subunit